MKQMGAKCGNEEVKKHSHTQALYAYMSTQLDVKGKRKNRHTIEGDNRGEGRDGRLRTFGAGISKEDPRFRHKAHRQKNKGKGCFRKEADEPRFGTKKKNERAFLLLLSL